MSIFILGMVSKLKTLAWAKMQTFVMGIANMSYVICIVLNLEEATVQFILTNFVFGIKSYSNEKIMKTCHKSSRDLKSYKQSLIGISICCIQ